jgi:hypothetical protein
MQAGGTSSSENAKLEGTFIDSQGKPVSGTCVLLLPNNFIPVEQSIDSIKQTMTNEIGSFSLENIIPGTYNLEAFNPQNGLRFLKTNIILQKKNIARLPIDTLKHPGTIIIALNQQTDSAKTRKVYIPGTTRYSIDSTNAKYIILDSVPAGIIPSVCVKEANNINPVVLKENLNVIPKDTTYCGYSAKIFINTTPTGANILETLTNFPIFIKITSKDFDFSSFANNGSDIRFFKPNGVFLASEIIQWDSINKQAGIFVFLDTVYGNSNSQYIIMNWGTSKYYSSPTNNFVFDTVFGFTGVWHLEESQKNVIKDATPNIANGANFINSLDQSGIVCNGRNFNGTDFILINNKKVLNISNSDFSISLWLYPRRERGIILSKDTTMGQDSCAIRLYLGDALSDSNGLHPCFGGKGSGVTIADSCVLLNQWNHIVFTWNHLQKTATFYINGKKSSTQTNTFLPISGVDNPNSRIIIGYDASYLFAYCDEIYISKVVRSESFIKLLYENQKQDSKIISFVKN